MVERDGPVRERRHVVRLLLLRSQRGQARRRHERLAAEQVDVRVQGDVDGLAGGHDLGFGRIVVSDTEVLNMLSNLG